MLSLGQLYNLLRKQGLLQPDQCRQYRGSGNLDGHLARHSDAPPDHRGLEQLARLETPCIGFLGLAAAAPIQKRLRPTARCAHEGLVGRGEDGA